MQLVHLSGEDNQNKRVFTVTSGTPEWIFTRHALQIIGKIKNGIIQNKIFVI